MGRATLKLLEVQVDVSEIRDSAAAKAKTHHVVNSKLSLAEEFQRAVEGAESVN